MSTINNEFLKDNIFTEYDELLTKKINTDPLGFQIVWTFFGQKIFHNKTTSIALDIRSYNINLFNHFIIYQIIQNNEGLSFDKLITNQITVKEKIEKTLVILENLLTWSWFCNRDNWNEKNKNGLIGTSKALSIWSQDTPLTINFNETKWEKIEVLKNQRLLGVSGRYKGPFRAMNFFRDYDENSYKSSSELFENIIGKELILPEKSPFKNLYNNVIMFLKEDKFNKIIQKDSILVEAYFKTFYESKTTAKCTKDFWLKQLGLEEEEAKIVYKYIDNENINSKTIFEKSYNEYQDSKIFKDILLIEPQLTYIDLLFEYLMSSDNLNINELESRYLDLLKTFEWNNLDLDSSISVKYRIEELGQITDYKTLIKYHEKLMKEQRGQNPWIELKDDTIKVNIVKNSKNDIVNRLDKEMDNDWVNDYYIRSIRNIKQGLET